MSIRRADSDEEKNKLARKVANYLLGDKDNGKEPMKISEIAQVLGFKSRKSVYQYQEIAIQLGYLELDENKKPILPRKTALGEFKTFSANHTILTNELVEYWYKKQLNKKGGTGIAVAKLMLNNLEKFFNTLRITPEMLVVEKSNKVVEDYRDQYLEHFRNGTAIGKTKKSGTGKIEYVAYQMNYALASFCAVNGISWARGDPAMSRKIVGHGKYADIRLTVEEFMKIDQYIMDKYGLDSDEYRWFWIGVESCSRQSALETMTLDFEKIYNKKGKPTLILKAYESKTKQINDGIWKKFIKRADTIQSLEYLKERGGTRIFENKDNLSLSAFRKKMIEFLKEIYRLIGKSEDSYFIRKANHALRHIGAHRLLEKGNYSNHVIVAKVGGWHTVDELIKSYGEIPPEKVNEELDKYDE